MHKWSTVSSGWEEGQEACVAPLTIPTPDGPPLKIHCQLVRGHDEPHEWVRTVMVGSGTAVMDETEMEIHWRRNQVPRPRTFRAQLAVQFEASDSEDAKEEGE